MKFSNNQWAKTLLETADIPLGLKRKEALKRFLALLQKKRGQKRLGKILNRFEKEYLTKHNLKKVVLESPQPASPRLKNEIEKLLGKNIVLREKTDPRLLAGVKILINDEILIDSSARTRIKEMFRKDIKIQ